MKTILKRYAPIAVVTVLGMQSLRVLLPLFQQYLRDALSIPSLTLAPIAIGLFAMAFLAGWFVRWRGLGATLAFSMAGIAVLRVLEQFSRSSFIDILLAGAAVVLFWWFLACVYALRAHEGKGPRVFPAGIFLGLSLDTAIHAATGTLDLSWMSGIVPLGVVALLAGYVLVTGPAWRKQLSDGGGETGLRVPGRMFAFGAWLLLEMMLFQNAARLGALSGWSLPVNGLVVTGGNVLALLALARGPSAGKHTAWISGLALVLLMIVPELNGVLAAVWLLAGQLLAAAWFGAVAGAPLPEKPARGRFGGTFGPAALLFVVCAFLYYVSYDLPIGLSGPQFLPVFAVFLLAAGFAPGMAQKEGSKETDPADLAWAGLALLVLPIAYALVWRAPVAQDPPADNQAVRIMSYNLHQAFSTSAQLSIEALAQQIEASGADVIAVQEVARGYLTTGSFDMLGWLSHRLGMPYFSGPASDAQWGNAILSRYPITDAAFFPLPPDNLLLKRSYIVASVDAGAGEITVIATHLHHLGSEGFIREEQVPVLLEAWGGQAQTIILGDMNARPDSPEMQMISDAGMLSASALSDGGPTFTFPSTGPDREIDHIWYTPDFTGSDFQIYQNTASDHLPIAVTLEIQ